MIKALDLHEQYLSIKNEIDIAIASVIKESAYIGGKYVEEFETEFAKYLQVEHCIGVGNGTDAIEIAIEALGLPINSEIIVPANSFVASSEAVTRAGRRVVFCDISEKDYLIDTEDLIQCITKNTSAILTVHLYGQPCNMRKIKDIANQYKLKIIEDCAQAHGAEIDGRRVGGIGDIAAYSFYPGKNLGAYGDGGAIVTNDSEIALRCRMIANHGRVSKYEHEFEGRNSRLDGIQAAVLSVKLKYLDSWIEKREQIAQIYLSALSKMEFMKVPFVSDKVKHVWHQFVVRTNHRAELFQYLESKKIGVGIHYPVALPDLNAYKYMQPARKKYVASKVAGEILSLPIGEHLTLDDANALTLILSEYQAA